MKKLFVKRDHVNLIEEEGNVEIAKDLPYFLKQKPLVVDPFFFGLKTVRQNEDLPVRQFDDEFTPKRYLDYYKEGVPALWSGYRSCITLDPLTQQLFRLKGVSFGKKIIVEDEDDHIRVLGGQFLQNAHYEKIYSDRFNKVLADNGIEPVMEYCGFYKFPFRVKRRKLATSIIRTLGDTRLDELFYMFEILYLDSIRLNGNKEKFERYIKELYLNFGYLVGNLKQLMDRNDQSWSDNQDRTNAHIGNVIVYKVGEDIKVGLVDFDASCDLRDKSKTELEEQQRIEYISILNSASMGGISYREIGTNFNPIRGVLEFRKWFAEGFIKGYVANNRFVCNTIEDWRLKELIDLLPKPIRRKVSRTIDDYFSRNNKKTIDKGNSFYKGQYGLDTIIKRDKEYNNSLTHNIKFSNNNFKKSKGKSLEECINSYYI